MARRRELRQQVLQALRDHLEGAAGEPFKPAESHHPADLADVLWLDMEKGEAQRIFRGLSPEEAAEVLAEGEPQLQEIVLEGMDPEELGSLLGKMPADDGADLLEVLSEEVRLQVMCFVDPEEAADLRHLSGYPADSAGGMMTTEFIATEPGEHVGDVLKRIKRDEDEAETIYALYVVDDRGALIGVLSTRELLEAGIHEEVKEIMNPDVLQARVDEDREEVAHRILHYNLGAIPIVDPRGHVVGIVTADDALEVLEEEGSEDALLLAGAGADSDAIEPLLSKVMHRAPMLVVTVAAGLLMSRLMNFFASKSGVEMSTFGVHVWADLVAYVPMVLALSGTIGMQTSAVLVRGFAVGQIAPGRRIPILLAEVQVGALLGFFCALLATPAAAIFAGDWGFGLVMGLALFLAMTWAATTSSSIAMGSEAAGLDPALVSGPVMMAVSDLSAVMLFFGSAFLLLQ